nr:hypothetical protein CFP56_73178 [Quercus suber]
MSLPHSPEDVEAIVRVCAYHRKDFDMAVTWISTREHIQVQECLLTTCRHPFGSLGVLDRLPLELATSICLELDMLSLFAFRHVNRRARQIVSSLPQYRIAVSHSLGCICASLRTKAAAYVTLSEYYRRLCETKCTLCGDNYGDLINLLNWKRCCSVCLRHHRLHVRVVTRSAARRVLQLSNKALEAIPTLKTLPGIYSMDERAHKSRHTILPLEAALSAYRSRNGGAEVSEGQLQPKSFLAFAACCAFPNYTQRTGQIQNGLSCVGCQVAIEKEAGALSILGPLRDSVYSRESFLQHFGTCQQAQLLWQSTREGTSEPEELPFSCKMGGYFNPRD